MARDMGRGIIAPDNNDNIGTGASEMRTLGATTAAAIAHEGTRAENSAVEKAKWLRGALSSSDNIDNLYEEDHTGGWRVETNSVSIDLGLPVMSPGILEVEYIVGVAQPSAFQTWKPRIGSHWQRTREGGVWSDWSQEAAPQAEINDAIQAAYESALDHDVYKFRDLTAGEDVFELTDSGVYPVRTYAIAGSLRNLPVPSSGVLIVSASDHPQGPRTISFSTATGELFQVGNMPSTTAWRDWENLSRRSQLLPDDTDIEQLRVLGDWRCSGVLKFNTLTGTPPVEPGPAVLSIRSHNGTNGTFRMWHTVDGQGIWYQALHQGTWSEWRRIDPDPVTPPLDVGYTGVPNIQLQDAFRDAYPLVSTGGKGVVCLRWDHGLTNFKDILQPLHEQYEIPGIIAMNSRNWDLAENSGMTKAEAAALAADGLIEWANHGADDGAGGAHRDESTREGIWDQIYNGRVELENDLGIPIWQYIVPGTGDSGMGGFYGGNSLDVFTRTYAGSVIMATHAISSGGFSDLVYSPLDGRVRHGRSRWAAETSTVEQVKTVIDQAASRGTCIWFLTHPRHIGDDGYLSAADWAEIFAYINQKIQAGELANISPLQSNHATAQE